MLSPHLFGQSHADTRLFMPQSLTMAVTRSAFSSLTSKFSRSSTRRLGGPRVLTVTPGIPYVPTDQSSLGVTGRSSVLPSGWGGGVVRVTVAFPCPSRMHLARRRMQAAPASSAPNLRERAKGERRPAGDWELGCTPHTGRNGTDGMACARWGVGWGHLCRQMRGMSITGMTDARHGFTCEGSELWVGRVGRLYHPPATVRAILVCLQCPLGARAPLGELASPRRRRASYFRQDTVVDQPLTGASSALLHSRASDGPSATAHVLRPRFRRNALRTPSGMRRTLPDASGHMTWRHHCPSPEPEAGGRAGADNWAPSSRGFSRFQLYYQYPRRVPHTLAKGQASLTRGAHVCPRGHILISG
jgi:hypothetical protein